MTKQVFLDSLRSKLSGLPKEDVDERISFYEEAINDRMDEGKSEEEAVAEIGSVDDVIKEIAKDTPLVSLVKHKMTPKRKLRGWEVALIICTFPFWLPLIITAIALTFAGVVVLWSGAIAVYSAEIGLVGTSIAGFTSFFAAYADGVFDLYYLGIALASVGGAFMMAFACYGVTLGMAKLTKLLITGIKSSFIKNKKRR